MTDNPKPIELELLAAVGTSDDIVAHKTAAAGPSDEEVPAAGATGPSPVIIRASDVGNFSEDTVRDGPRQGFNEGLRIVRGDDKRSYNGDVTVDGAIIESMAGAALSTDDGELQVAHVLVERHNHDGGNWGPARKATGVEKGIDCEADDLADDTRKLSIQVTIPPENGVLQRLGNGHPVDRNQQAAEAVELLRQAVAKKHQNDLKHRPARGGSKVVLAIDATDRAGYAFQVVVSDFRALHGEWAKGLGFEAIWLVGPTAQTTYRLDV
ncbi:hypothetical protein ACGF07_22890 [Kitasatospora sp. NPDC048194]|uniref:hypothetical protein n=1 Tax=Kitasatospora sp. NPDC048194 TaxID=3364045 RepID=UPI00371F68EB